MPDLKLYFLSSSQGIKCDHTPHINFHTDGKATVNSGLPGEGTLSQPHTFKPSGPDEIYPRARKLD